MNKLFFLIFDLLIFASIFCPSTQIEKKSCFNNNKNIFANVVLFFVHRLIVCWLVDKLTLLKQIVLFSQRSSFFQIHSKQLSKVSSPKVNFKRQLWLLSVEEKYKDFLFLRSWTTSWWITTATLLSSLCLLCYSDYWQPLLD